MAIKVLSARGSTQSEIARLLGVTEGAVRYHARRMAVGAVDGRGQQRPKAEAFAAAIEHWRGQQDGGGVNLAALHEWLRREHGYDGSLRSVQRYWRRSYPAPAVRARRRVETPPGAQAQVDWAHFPAVIVGDEAVDLVALHMVLSWSRQEAIVWARSKDMLAWLGCHTACFVRLGGVPATLRVDNEKTAIARGAGAWGTINPTLPALCRADEVPRRCLRAAPAAAQGQGRAPGARPSRRHRSYGRSFRDLAELQAWTDARLAARAAERRCPATGTTVAEAWAEERRLLTPLPETAPEPFDLVAAPAGRPRRARRLRGPAVQRAVPPRRRDGRGPRRRRRGAGAQGLRGRRLPPARHRRGGSSSTSATTRARAPSG